MNFGKLSPVNNAKISFPGFQEILDFTVPTPDAYTKLLLHCNGADNATSMYDECGKGVTFSGTAQLDTAEKKFGVSSLWLDGNSDYVTLADSDDWTFGAGDFTVDLWIKRHITGSSQTIMSNYQANGAYNTMAFIITSGDSIGFMAYDGSANLLANYVTQTALTDTTSWHHIAFVRNGTNFYIFLDGVSQTLTVSTAIGNSTLANSSGALEIGRVGGYTNLQHLGAWIDEIRISKGIARWTSNFTPPTSEYTDSYATYNLAVDGDTDKEFVIDLFNTNASQYIRMRLNNSTTNNGFQYILNSAGTISANRGTPAYIYGSQYVGESNIVLLTPTGYSKTLQDITCEYSSGTTVSKIIVSGWVYNSTANITSIDFDMSSGNFTAGTRIYVGVRRSS